MYKNQASFAVRVTGLPNQTKKEHLLKTFSQSGKITKCELTSRSGKLEGRVYFSNSNEMYEAVWNLHDSDINGKKISVTILLSNPKDLFDLYVTGHPPHASKNELREMISDLCQVKCIRITNKGKYCFLQIHGHKDAIRALDILDGSITKDGSRLSCQISKKKAESAAGQMELAHILNQICFDSHILPAFTPQDMHILEKSLRTFHLSGLPMESGDQTLKCYFEKFGEVENYARIVKDSFSTAYGFVVFKSHRSSENFRVSGEGTMFVDNHMVRIAPSKSTKTVNELAQSAGLLDYEMNPTQLLYTVLESALEIFESRNPIVKTGVKEVYLQDPTTGLCYKWETTEQAYAQYIDQQIRLQQEQIRETQRQAQKILSSIAQLTSSQTTNSELEVLQFRNRNINSGKCSVNNLQSRSNNPQLSAALKSPSSTSDIDARFSRRVLAPISINQPLCDPTRYLSSHARFSPY